jgi:plasmid maintenance system antidote protein VapI
MRLRGLSITQVAKLGGPSARQISDHLCQVRALTPDNRIALAHLLGVDIRLL